MRPQIVFAIEAWVCIFESAFSVFDATADSDNHPQQNIFTFRQFDNTPLLEVEMRPEIALTMAVQMLPPHSDASLALRSCSFEVSLSRKPEGFEALLEELQYMLTCLPPRLSMSEEPGEVQTSGNGRVLELLERSMYSMCE